MLKFMQGVKVYAIRTRSGISFMRNQPPYVRIIGIRFIGYDLNRPRPVPPLVICTANLATFVENHNKVPGSSPVRGTLFRFNKNLT